MPDNLSRLHTETTPSSASKEAVRWYRFRLFNYFRSAMALFFITLYLNGWLQAYLAGRDANLSLYLLTATIYLSLCFVFMFLISLRKPRLEIQVILQTLLDISAIVLLMHASGGIRSGVGMLLIISTSMTSLFLRKRLSLLFAAIATLSVLTEQVLTGLATQDYQTAFTQAGMLGLLIFTSTLLTAYITKHLHDTEALAEHTSQELESVVQMNSRIIQNMRTGIIVTSNEGEILMSNNAAAQLLNRNSIPVHARLDKINPTIAERFQTWLAENSQNHRPIPQNDGLPDIQAGFSAIDKRPGKLGKTLIFLDDATQLTQRFQQVKLASLGRLTASIAHEIRNPLAAINHAAQLLGESVASDADAKLTRIINTQTRRLNNIVENVLQLSRQQRGTPDPIELNDWLEQFQQEFTANQSLRPEQLVVRLDQCPLPIAFDSTQLHQVMWNLCANAIHHGGQPAADVRIELHGGIDTTFNQPYLDISDNGAGIDEETLSHIFEPFYTTSTSGTGLGLYITREVVETNRAKIRYIKGQTQGSRFRLYFMPASDVL